MVDKTTTLPTEPYGCGCDPEVIRTPSLSLWRRTLYQLSYGVQTIAPVSLCPCVNGQDTTERISFQFVILDRIRLCAHGAIVIDELSLSQFGQAHTALRTAMSA